VLRAVTLRQLVKHPVPLRGERLGLFDHREELLREVHVEREGAQQAADLLLAQGVVLQDAQAVQVAGAGLRV
jgi:hypothetical protein